MGSEEGEKNSSSRTKKIKYKRTGDWGPVPHPSKRPTWGRFKYNPEDEKRMADEWRDEGRKTEKRLQEEHVARETHPPETGKRKALRSTTLERPTSTHSTVHRQNRNLQPCLSREGTVVEISIKRKRLKSKGGTKRIKL
jgi:hypothetical protein